MQKSNNITIKDKEIRHHFDKDLGIFNYSVVDVIDSLGLSSDPRNYWKVLKNRLNKRDNKLVTECNQEKLRSSDGKYYLTDVAEVGTLLKIIEVIDPTKVSLYEEIFNKIERENGKKTVNYFGNNFETEKISTGDIDECEIKVDMYEKDNMIFLKALVCGIDPNDIFISLNCRMLTMKFNRMRDRNIRDEDYLSSELLWGKFSRTISLPFEVDIDRVEANVTQGMLQIKLFVLDKTRTKIVKVRN